MTYNIPEPPKNSFRITLELNKKGQRIDTILLNALRDQNDNKKLKNISRSQLKQAFKDKKVFIKGQNAKISSTLNSGTTYVDILL